MDRFVNNPSPPPVRFIRKNGRVIPIFDRSNHHVAPLRAARLVKGQLGLMQTKVEEAEAGQRVHVGYGTDHEVRGFKSSFPSFYGAQGFRGKQDFRAVLERPGVRQERLLGQAVTDLKKDEDYGLGAPHGRGMEFRLATRATWDNDGVIFRKLGGKVHPMRIRRPKKVTIEHAKPETEEPWL